MACRTTSGCVRFGSGRRRRKSEPRFGAPLAISPDPSPHLEESTAPTNHSPTSFFLAARLAIRSPPGPARKQRLEFYSPLMDPFVYLRVLILPPFLLEKKEVFAVPPGRPRLPCLTRRPRGRGALQRNPSVTGGAEQVLLWPGGSGGTRRKHRSG